MKQAPALLFLNVILPAGRAFTLRCSQFVDSLPKDSSPNCTTYIDWVTRTTSNGRGVGTSIMRPHYTRENTMPQSPEKSVSFIERTLSSGSSTRPVPTLEASRSSAETLGSNTELTNPQKLAAYRTWMPALIIWALACATHLGTFAYSLAEDQRNPLSHENKSHNGFLSYLNIWDAGWYRGIYKEWYPTELPLRADGSVSFNSWAFMPLHSMISGKVADIFGIEYRLAAVGVSLAAGLALAVVLYRLFVGSLNWRDRGVFDTRALVGDESRNRIALWALAVYAFSPASPIFVTGYAEALSTLLLALSVWCVVRSRYILLLPVALLTALSRPLGVPLGAFVGLWWLWCTVSDYLARRTGEPSQSVLSDVWAAFRGRIGQLLGALLVCSFAFVHPLHAALRTGRMDAYLATELGWSFRKVEDGHQYFAQWVHQFNLYYVGSVPAIIMWAALVLLILSFYWWMSQKFTRTLLHPALRLWTACYAGYLFIFWLPTSSTVRILLPLFPLSLLIAAYLPKSRMYRLLLVLVGLLGSALWMRLLWGGPDVIGPVWLLP